MTAPELVKSSVQRLDDGTKRYYNKVESYLEEETEDNRELFCKNVIRQVCDKDGLVRVSCDKDGSRSIERLLRENLVDEGSLGDLVSGMLSEHSQVTTNKCGSHVLEALLKTVARTLGLNSSQLELSEKFHSLCGLLTDQVEELVVNQYGSHVVSCLLEVLSGVYLNEAQTRSRYSQEFRKAKMADVHRDSKATTQHVPDSFSEPLEEVYQRIYKNDHFAQWLTHRCGSPVVQALLRVMAAVRPKKAARLIKKIIKLSISETKTSKDKSALLPMFTDQVGSHLLETVIEVASSEVLGVVYESCFEGKLMSFAVHPVANFTLQKLLSSTHPVKVPGIVEELSSIEEILFAGHNGVVVKLVEVCLSCPEKQETLLHNLLTAFHAESQPELCVQLFLAMTAYEVYIQSKDEKPPPISLHGSLVVQALLKFENTKVVARSLVKMESCDLLRMSCDPCGSHVMSAFMVSTSVSGKNKLKMITKLEGDLVQLSKDKHGSRVMDALWRNCEIAHKDKLAQILLTHESELSDDFFGHIVLKNCNLSHYKMKQESWVEQEKAASRKRALFDDIISQDSVAPSRKKKKC